jgi:K+-sensing histidine kinase KdpD
VNEFASPVPQARLDQPAAILPTREPVDDLDEVEPLPDDPDTDELDAEPFARGADVRRREGLPTGFRMRHDAHYVDELTAPRPAPAIRMLRVADLAANLAPAAAGVTRLVDSIKRFGVLQPVLVASDGSRHRLIDGARRVRAAVLAGIAEIPALVHDVELQASRELALAANERATAQESPAPGLLAAVAGDLTGRLEMLAAQARVVTDAPASLTGLAADLLHLEISRTTRLARAAQFTGGMPPLSRRESAVASLVERAVEETAASRRLSGMSLDLSIEDGEFRVPVDADLVNHALTSALDVMQGLAAAARPGRRDARPGGEPVLAIAVQCPKIRPAMVIVVSQRGSSVDPAELSAFVERDAELPAHAGATGVLLASCARIVRAHGGRVEVRETGPIGCALALVFPQIASRSAAL